MSEKDKPFVINDRRKFRMDGEPREPIAPAEPEAAKPAEAAAPAPGPVAVTPIRQEPTPIREVPPRDEFESSAHLVTPVPEPADAAQEAAAANGEPPLPPPPTAKEVEQVKHAYETTAERLDTMIRSQNLGAEHLPPMDFTQLVQSIYMSAMMQLGAGTQQGQQPRVDILGAKQSIDMLAVIEDKTGTNLTDAEKRLIEDALFELRMGFLEITQLLARQAAARQTQAPGTPPAGPTGGAGGGFGGGGFTGGGPRIVR